MIYLGLGSNICDKLNFIKSAEEEISKLNKTKVLRSSSIYKTEPWGIKSQEEFLNSVLEIESELEPEELLIELKLIEIVLGRKNREKWSKREIDIDILLYDNVILNNDSINIPHPEIPNRKFVLVPLCELNSGFIHPVINDSLENLLKNSKDNSRVIKIQVN
ncbi:MAG: 2-amino-4-hydroxy-6-hydroxymethyldihydropteridine diphosphokinase [Ignavibacteriae bacterium]|nr:2-amino-4-hydroxy-6-hydroxymethyldihydropteridine diphosphokinase [Ignavibacteriota bacterium]